jgi:DNA-directed RNA polymerase specialized sigma24 family protein
MNRSDDNDRRTNRPNGGRRPAGRPIRGQRHGTADAVLQEQITLVWITAIAFVTSRHGLGHDDATEVAGYVVEQFMARPSHWLDLYSTPEKFARAVSDSRFYDWLGIVRRQRGEGRTLIRLADGGTRKRRYNTPLTRTNEESGEEELLPLTDGTDSFVDDVITRVDIERLTEGLTADQAEAIQGVVVEDRTKVDVASDDGVAHTTIMNRANKGLAQLRDGLGEHYLVA